MKSRLLTRLPGTKNRISIDFSELNPGTSGLTIGRSSNETKHSACFSCAEVKGKRSNSGGGANAPLEHSTCGSFWHADFIFRHGQPSFSDVENPLRCSAVAFWVVQHPLPDPIGIHNFRPETITDRRQERAPCQTISIQYECACR